MIQNQSAGTKIIPVASGKGGVGKSFACVNLAASLAAAGKHTVLVDLDLGGSNIHTYLGVRNTYRGIGTLLSDHKLSFDDIVHPSPYPNLDFVPGDVLVTGLATLTAAQRKRIVNGITGVSADYVILDLGSGTTPQVLDFFLISNSGIIVTTPQPAAAVNAYSFLKNLVFRALLVRLADRKEAARYLREAAKEKRPGSAPRIDNLLKEVGRIDSGARKTARTLIKSLRPFVLGNLVEDAELFQRLTGSLRDLSTNNLNLDLSCLGVVFRDPAAEKADLEGAPIVSAHPEALAATQLDRAAQKILQSPSFPELPLDYEEYADSFELSMIEARLDREQARAAAAPDDSMSQEDFVQLVAEQQKKISELKQTIRNLTVGQQSPG